MGLKLTSLLPALALGMLPWLTGCNDSALSAEDAAHVSALVDRIASLEAEASLLQDASAIKRLQHAYGYYLDEALWDQVATLMTDDVSAEYGLSGVYVGKEHVLQQMLTAGGGRSGLAQGQLNDHLQLQPVITVAPDGLSAKGRWRAFIMRGQYGASAEWSEGPYENEYRKEDGIWKISKIHWFETFTAPYEGGWAQARQNSAEQDTVTTLPPDLPSSVIYQGWPGVHYVPFHYPHPVTGVPTRLPGDGP